MADNSSKVSPAPLQHLAITQAAINLLDHRIRHETPDEYYELFWMITTTDHLPLPNVMNQTLYSIINTNSPHSILWEIAVWIRFHRQHGIFISEDNNDNHGCEFHYLTTLVWHDDGTINYIATAENFLQNPSVLEEEKRNMAMVYSFMDYISENFSNLEKEDIKRVFTPSQQFNTMLKIVRLGTGRILHIHKILLDFLYWYFESRDKVTEFTYAKLLEFIGTEEESQVRILLIGMGHNVPLPT